MNKDGKNKREFGEDFNGPGVRRDLAPRKSLRGRGARVGALRVKAAIHVHRIIGARFAEKTRV